MIRWLVFAVLLAGCAPTVQAPLNGRADPALNADTAVMPDGAALPVRRWEADDPRAVIVAVHGFNDYSNAFALPGPWFAARGVSVYAYDQRGFGEAPGRGLWAGDARMAADLATMVRLARDRHPGTPVYVLGASMGGAVALTALAQETAPDADGVILVAPAVWGWSALNPVYRATLWVTAHTIPWQTFTGRGLGVQASDNIEMLRAFSADPLVIKETRTDAIYGLVDLMERAYLRAGDVQTPVLLLYGARDEVVPADPVADIGERIAAPLTAAVYPDGWHMLLRDRQRETVWRDIESWIANPAAPLPSGAAGPPEVDIRTAAAD